MPDETPKTTTPADNQPVDKIDINKPVEQGHDMVINHLDGSQELGTAEERSKVETDEGTAGRHTDPVASADNAQAPATPVKEDKEEESQPTTAPETPADKPAYK